MPASGLSLGCLGGLAPTLCRRLGMLGLIAVTVVAAGGLVVSSGARVAARPAGPPGGGRLWQPESDPWARYRQAMTSRGGLAMVSRSRAAAPRPREYTWDWDFDEGVMVGVNHDSPNNHQLQLNETPSTFPFVWIALSGRDTVAKIDTRTGVVLGEYLSRPNGRAGNPSRTTVDLDGAVWVGNRAEGQGGGSVIKIGLLEAGGCIDRNHNGVIDTSMGLRDVLPWRNGGGVDDNGGVTTAEDECIVSYVRVPPIGVRTIAVDADNNVWLGGPSDHIHVHLDGRTGAILQRVDAACGGYGGLIDGNGVLWSAASLMYLDTGSQPLRPRCINTRGRTSYGLGVNTHGYVWNSSFGGDSVVRYSPSGEWTGEFPTGGASGDRGVAITPADNHVWVANSFGSDVSRLSEDGAILAVVRVGGTPTGVAVDQAGKVWVTNMGSNTASRIDPATDQVDLTVDLGAGATPYNYSDMTGMVSRSFTTRRGTWLVIHDSGSGGTPWGTVTWTSSEPLATTLDVRVRGADSMADLGSVPWQAVVNGQPMMPTTGRFLQVEAILSTQYNGITPILYDLTVWPAGVPTPGPSPTDTPSPTPSPTATVTAKPTPTPLPLPLYLPLALREDCPVIVEHADIALVVDASTSMLGPTADGASKLDATQAAIRAFIEIIGLPGDRVAVVAFNRTAWVVQPLTGDPLLLGRALAGISVQQQTRTDLALEVAAAELARGRPERPDNRPVIILLTDGLPNPVGSDEVLRVAAGLRAADVTVFAIGLGLDVNAELLRAVATSPGHYYASPGGDDLEVLYRRIARVLPCPGVVFWPAGQ